MNDRLDRDREAELASAVEAAETAHGEHSPEHARALADAGRFYAERGDYEAAVDAFEDASEVIITGDQVEKEWLAYMSDYGRMLGAVGRLEEAEEALRTSAAEHEKIYGREHPSFAAALEVLAELELLRGDPQTARNIMERAVSIYRQHGDPRVERASTSRAKILQEMSSARARVLRDHALSLSERSEVESARRKFAEAVKAAREAEDGELLARILFASGVFEQHQERFAEARAQLEEALSYYDAPDPEVISAKHHLRALAEKERCGCGDLSEVMSEMLEELIAPEVPPGLLKRLAAELDEADGFKLSVELARDPTPAEWRHLDRTLKDAVAVLKTRLREKR